MLYTMTLPDGRQIKRELDKPPAREEAPAHNHGVFKSFKDFRDWQTHGQFVNGGK